MELRRKIEIKSKRTLLSILLFIVIPIIGLLLDILVLGEWDVGSTWSLLYGAGFLYSAMFFPPLLLVVVPLILLPYALIGILISTVFQRTSSKQYVTIVVVLFLIAVFIVAIIPTRIKLKEQNKVFFVGYTQEDCNQINDSRYKETCIKRVTTGLINNLDSQVTPQFCNNLEDSNRQYCWRILSRNKGSSIDFCDQAVESGKDGCIIGIAQQKRDSDICKMLSNEVDIQSCSSSLSYY